MSWQATAWAIKQATGSTRRKAVLMALANYADANGECWPSQERLARDTEQSVDSVQRHSDALEQLKLIEREILPKRRGQYAGYRYRLAMQIQ
jgi:DNA-binding MarR family transcriptional regulator